MIPAEDGLAEVDELEYHADRGSLSVSGAKLLLPPSCPAKFRWQMDNERKPKRVWDFGHVAHHIVLGMGAEFVVLDPLVVGLKKDGTPADSPRATATWKAAEAEARAAGLVPIHIDEYLAAEAMAAEVLAHPDAGPLFESGQAEQSMYWTDPSTDIRLRGRTDWLTVAKFGGTERFVCVDYKTSTTANPAELERKFWTLNYFMQAPWYLDLLVALGIAENPAFLFVVQEKEPPYLVTVIEYDAPAIAQGRRQNRRAIETYTRCRDTDTWPGYSDGITPLTLPPWAFSSQPTIADLYEEIDA